jgi:PhzF family phenazine biosynthesis protein
MCCVCLQGAGGQEYDLLSRFFAPWCGIDEDAVTGSAHAVLGPYWAERLGRVALSARQCSRRGGDLQLSVDWEQRRVEVAGHAVVVLAGSIRL